MEGMAGGRGGASGSKGSDGNERAAPLVRASQIHSRNRRMVAPKTLTIVLLTVNLALTRSSGAGLIRNGGRGYDRMTFSHGT